MANRPLPIFNSVFIPTFLCLLAIHSASAKEPAYDGKPLSQWLCCEPLEDAQNAVQKIGTDAIPTLLDMVGITEKTAKKVAGKLGSETIRREASSEDFRIDDVQNIAVEKGFAVSGTNAESAIPKLIKLLDDEETSGHAAQALAVIGPRGFAALTNYLAVGSMRGSVIVALGQKGGGNPQLVTKLLVGALKDENPGIRNNAADFLRDRDPALAIPALTQALDDNQLSVRQRAATALGSYGPAAKEAAPKILSLYTNAPDVFVLEALKKIDPETAGQAEAFLLNGHLGTVGNGWTTTRLPNGKDLIAGGSIPTEIPTPANHVFSRAELYDPISRKYTETGAMNTARYFHTATLLPNGKVLVAGSEDANGNAISSAELYDLTTGKWTETGSMIFSYPHSGHKAILRREGTVLVFAERWGGPIYNVEQYNPATEKWSAITNLTSIPK